MLTTDELRDRPHPKTLDTEEIQREASELSEIYFQAGSDLEDAINGRFSKMHAVLETRLNPDFPTCPHCQSRLQHDEQGRPICTGGCDEPLPDDVIEAYKTEYRRLWESELGDDDD